MADGVLGDVATNVKAAVAAAADAASLDDVRVQYLGKKGELTSLLKGLGKLSPEERPAAGAEINKAKEALQASIAERKTALDSEAINAKVASETIDVTLPGRNQGAVRASRLLRPRPARADALPPHRRASR